MEIHKECAQEIYDLCVRHNLPDTWAYLYKQWYCPNRWVQWSRASFPSTLPAGKTTMFIESHWRVLKKCHLYKFNRARLDLLTYIIIDRHCRALFYKFNRDVLKRNQASRWEQNFCNAWNGCVNAAQQPMNSYYISVFDWICGCPAFLKSKFMICKHLVSRYVTENNFDGNGKIAPKERFILRKTRSPYIEISERVIYLDKATIQ